MNLSRISSADTSITLLVTMLSLSVPSPIVHAPSLIPVTFPFSSTTATEGSSTYQLRVYPELSKSSGILTLYAATSFLNMLSGPSILPIIHTSFSNLQSSLPGVRPSALSLIRPIPGPGVSLPSPAFILAISGPSTLHLHIIVCGLLTVYSTVLSVEIREASYTPFSPPIPIISSSTVTVLHILLPVFTALSTTCPVPAACTFPSASTVSTAGSDDDSSHPVSGADTPASYLHTEYVLSVPILRNIGPSIHSPSSSALIDVAALSSPYPSVSVKSETASPCPSAARSGSFASPSPVSGADSLIPLAAEYRVSIIYCAPLASLVTSFFPNISASTPATWGAAIEVPVIRRYLPESSDISGFT